MTFFHCMCVIPHTKLNHYENVFHKIKHYYYSKIHLLSIFTTIFLLNRKTSRSTT